MQDQLMPTGRSLAEKNIITNVEEENIAQVGIDLNLIDVQRVLSNGSIPKVGKTVLADRLKIKPVEKDGSFFWELEPGVYDVTMSQGCNIPANMALFIRQRSSLLRNGTILHSSVFDPGFQTKNIGTIMHVQTGISIEFGARVAQIYAHICEAVAEKDLYGAEGKGSQFQGDIQRTL